MEIVNQSPISGTCDQCKRAWSLTAPFDDVLRCRQDPQVAARLAQRVADSHRERSPNCPRAKAVICKDRSYLDDITWQALTKTRTNGATPVFRMIWRDADELDLSKEERKTPMIIMGR
jgi:hypothetical protein